MCSAVHEVTLSSHADCSQDVVSGAHDIANSGLVELVYYPSCGRFKLILEDEEANKVEVRLGFKARHFLRFEPA